MDRYLELLDVDTNTRKGYEGYIKNHIRPLLGEHPVGRLDGETLDSFYTILRTCRAHCGGRKYIEHHHTKRSEERTDRCRTHKCRPLENNSIRQINWCLSGALKRAVRWRWITINPIDQAEPPKATPSNPHPPTPEQAAAIVNKALKDFPWGMLIWVAMTTGARRGELCALQWHLLTWTTLCLEFVRALDRTVRRPGRRRPRPTNSVESHLTLKLLLCCAHIANTANLSQPRCGGKSILKVEYSRPRSITVRGSSLTQFRNVTDECAKSWVGT